MLTEEVAHWYFRLNGFLTIPNFVLHPPSRGGQRTDVDIVGVRFPHRREFGTSPGDIDDAEFSKHGMLPYLLLAEVKSKWVGINEAWRNEARRTIEDVLTSLGIFEVAKASKVARALRTAGHHTAPDIHCSLFLIGEQLTDSGLAFPEVPHRTWNDVLSFIYRRFSKYDRLKTDTKQWDDTGRSLFALSDGRSEEDYIAAARERFYLPAA